MPEENKNAGSPAVSVVSSKRKRGGANEGSETAQAETAILFDAWLKTEEGLGFMRGVAAEQIRGAFSGEVEKIKTEALKENNNRIEKLEKGNEALLRQLEEEKNRPRQFSKDEREAAAVSIKVMRANGLYADAAKLEHMAFGSGTGTYIRTTGAVVKEVWYHKITVSDVVVYGGGVLALLFIYEMIAAAAGWPSFEILVGRALVPTGETVTDMTAPRSRTARA